MTINELMERKGLTKYRLAKESGVPYATVNDICRGKARLERCAAETVYRISKALGIPMESIIEPCLEKRIDFELFKSDVCHELKRLGDIDFLIKLLDDDPIRGYYEKGWYPECLYLLAMLDYLSRINDVPICTDYDDLRGLKLKRILYPAGPLAVSVATESDAPLRKAVDNAIPEFMRFNIVEGDVWNVI